MGSPSRTPPESEELLWNVFDDTGDDDELGFLEDVYSTSNLSGDEPPLVKVLEFDSVRLGHNQHALDTLAGTLLAEHHLQNGMVDGLAGDLPAEQIQLAV